MLNLGRMGGIYLFLSAIVLIAATKVNGHGGSFAESSKGSLLTPEQGCGYTKVRNTRIVGGAPAKNGKSQVEIIF